MADLSTAVPASTYTPKKFNKEKYTVEGYQYPSDLMGTTTDNSGNTQWTYGGNYVIFYINVNNESKMLENPDAGVQVVDVDESERVKKGLVGREYTQNALIGTALGVGAGAAAASSLFGVSTGLTTAGAVTAAVGGGAVLSSTKNSTFSRPQKRLKTTIAMHVPNQLSIRYGAGWSEEETFGIQAIMEGGEALVRAAENAGKALTDKNKSVKDAVLGEVKGVAPIVANKALQASGGLSALTGLAPNPMKEQAFKGVDFRTFTMEYQFAPRDIIESNNVNAIIQAFKYHMHPEYKDSNNFLFLYPSEFDIEYYYDGEENMNIHRHTSCVLTEMNVNYTPNGTFSTFAGGRPTQINLSLTFKELTILTKELIAQGL